MALASAEAELYGLVRASAEILGLISMYKDVGTHMNGVVLGDASAALAIVARRGLGKLRHLDTNYLWIQEKAAKGDLNFNKVAGADNGAVFSRKPCRGMRYRATSITVCPEYHATGNKFERFRGFLELISRFEFEFSRRENIFFERFEFFGVFKVQPQAMWPYMCMCCGLFAPTQFHFECCGVRDDS